MASPADEALSALPPIKTAPSSTPSPSPVSASAEDAQAGDDQEPRTPTSEESRLRPPTECPPAPRKPPRLPAKRKSPPSSLVFVAVPRDLSAVFRSLPPKKRIRAW